MKVNIIFIFGELKFKSLIGLHKSAFQESHLLTNLLLSTYPFSKSQFCRKWEVSGRGRWSLIDPLQISKKRGMLPGVTRCCLSINLSHLLIFQDHDAHGPEFLNHMQRINAESGAKITVSMQWRLFSLGMKSFAADTYSHPICMIEIFIVFNPKSSENATNEITLNNIWYPLIYWSPGLLKKTSRITAILWKQIFIKWLSWLLQEGSPR